MHYAIGAESRAVTFRVVVPAIDAHRHPGQAKREPGPQKKISAAIYYGPG
jgi:hypothetical protein